jgi:hypothetical protein
MRLFVSYDRPDWSRVDSLVTSLRQAGIEVWLGSALVGGWPWWDKIPVPSPVPPARFGDLNGRISAPMIIAPVQR